LCSETFRSDAAAQKKIWLHIILLICDALEKAYFVAGISKY
jgi:hypothetical protein